MRIFKRKIKEIEKWAGYDFYSPLVYNTTKKELRVSDEKLSYIIDSYFFDIDNGSKSEYHKESVRRGTQGLHLELEIEDGMRAGLPIRGCERIKKLLIKNGATNEEMDDVDLNALSYKKGVSYFSGVQHLGTCL